MTGQAGLEAGVGPRLTRGGCPSGGSGAPRRAFILLLGAWLVGLLAVTAPHLVHHAFDADGGEPCAFFDAVHHAPAVGTTPVSVPQPRPVADALPIFRIPVAPRLEAVPPLSRSPPAVVLAAA